MSFVHYQARFVRSPRETIVRLRTRPDSVLIGFKNVSLAACLYEVAILLWLFGEAEVTAPPFLRIPDAQYYSYEVIFFVPVFVGTWLLAAGIIYLLSKALGGTGDFDSLLGSLGVGVAVCAYFTMIPDLIQGVLFSTGWMPQDQYLALTGQGVWAVVVWAYLIGYLVSNVAAFTLSTYYTTQGLSKLKSALVGVVSFAGYFALFLTFIR